MKPGIGPFPMVAFEFKPDNLDAVSDALDIAEEATSDFFKFSSAQWKRHCYEVRTLSSWACEDAPEWALAVLTKGISPDDTVLAPSWRRDCYFICLRDHRILEAVSRDSRLDLLPILVYVLTHELVHIVRFSSFLQRFMAAAEDREKEERLVYDITHKILHKLPMPSLDYVLRSYSGHRICSVQD